MSALTDRITEVLRAHRYTPFVGVCPCGFRFDTREGHEAHVAERIEAELQLTEEWTWSWSEHLTADGRPGYGFSVPTREEAAAEADSYMAIVRRWVSAWSEVES